MRLRLVLLAIVLLALFGCGGGGGGGHASSGTGGSGVSTVAGASFQIAWPARSKAIAAGSTSAQSARVVLAAASASGADVTVAVVRDANPAAYVGTYAVPVAIEAGTGIFRATFFATNDGTGAVVSMANGAYTTTNGSLGIGTVTLVGTIKAVAVLALGTLTAGTAAVQLAAQATDATGALVAITPGSVHGSLSGSTTVASLTDDGVLTPLAAGTATVRVAVDGASGSFTVDAAPVAGAAFAIAWPERTRALEHGLNSARSATVVLSTAAADGSDVAVRVNRDATNLAAHTETYAVGQPIRPGPTTVAATFYALADQGGAVVGIAAAAVSLNGTSLDFASIVVGGTVKAVAVVPAGPFVAGGAATQLQASATDAAGAIVAITPGSLHWSVASGSGALAVTPDGVATPTASGTVGVQVAVDGVTSAVASVLVTAPTPTASTLGIEATLSRTIRSAA